MTASQRPERIGRAALDYAAAQAFSGAPFPSARSISKAAAALDAILPLIADAIEAEADRRRASMAAISWGGLTHDPASAHYLRRAARLVRSLGDEQ